MVTENSPRGFNLFELVVVMAIIGVVAAIAVPRYAESLARYRADAAAQRIVADLELAAKRAQQTSQTRWVWFRIPENQLKIPGISHLDDPTGTYTVELGDDPYRAQLVEAEFDPPPAGFDPPPPLDSVLGGITAPIVAFDGFGKPVTGGHVLVSAGAHTKTIVLDVNTAEATIQ